MHPPHQRDRRPERRRPAPSPHAAAPHLALDGARVVLVGYFSAKEKRYATVMAEAAAALEAHGAQVVARAVQRRGVSDGGVRTMSRPYSSRTLLSHGKARELAATCAATEADAAVFATPLTDRQRRTLTALLGCPALPLTEMCPAPPAPLAPLAPPTLPV